MRGSVVRLAVLAVIVSACGTAPPTASPGQPSAAPGQAIVSLTFDDGIASVYLVRPILAAHGMHATFFLNSGHVGMAGFISWQQVQDLYQDGNEIGGHTALHVNLTQIDRDEAQREICNDRVSLLAHGFPVTDFAYPFGESTEPIQALVRACGYNAGRTTSHFSGSGVTIPPAEPYAIGVGTGNPVVASMEKVISDAIKASTDNKSNSWVPLVFHGICNGCSELGISQADFTGFLDWLQGQHANVVVETVAQVIGGTEQAIVHGPAASVAPSGTNGVRNPSFEQATDANGPPDCWSVNTVGNNTATWVRTKQAHSGGHAERVVVINYVDGNNRLAIVEDLGACTPSVVPGHQYVITAWYQSAAPVSFTAHTRSTTVFAYWMQSPVFPASSKWTLARWVTPAVPSDVDGLSFGILMNGGGVLSVDDVGIDDAGPSARSS